MDCRFGVAIDCHDSRAKTKFGTRLIRVSPDCLHPTAPPKSFRQWRTVVRRIGLVAHHQDRPNAIDFTDTSHRRVTCAATADHEIFTALHDYLPALAHQIPLHGLAKPLVSES